MIFFLHTLRCRFSLGIAQYLLHRSSYVISTDDPLPLMTVHSTKLDHSRPTTKAKHPICRCTAWPPRSLPRRRSPGDGQLHVVLEVPLAFAGGARHHAVAAAPGALVGADAVTPNAPVAHALAAAAAYSAPVLHGGQSRSRRGHTARARGGWCTREVTERQLSGRSDDHTENKKLAISQNSLVKSNWYAEVQIFPVLQDSYKSAVEFTLHASKFPPIE